MRDAPPYQRMQIGQVGFLALHEGTKARDLEPGLVRNAPDVEVQTACRQVGMPLGRFELTFTVFAAETPEGLILFDAGHGQNGPASAGLLASSLAAAGHSHEDVSAILITHFHGDHILGLITREGMPAFPRARILLPRVEQDFWRDADPGALPSRIRHLPAQAERVFAPLTEHSETFDWGDVVLPGIRALPLPGHTPGHTGFLLESGQDSLIVAGDVLNLPGIFALNPDWQAVFDFDGPLAAQTRNGFLDQAARCFQKVALSHAPFPAVGTFTPAGKGFAWCPTLRKTRP